MATNREMIEEITMLMGYEYDGENLKTFQEWQNAGFTVSKGEKAFLSLDLWKPFIKKLVDEKTGEKIIDEKTGKQKEETRFMLKLCHLFTPAQVKEGVIERKPKKAGKKKTTYKKKKTA